MKNINASSFLLSLILVPLLTPHSLGIQCPQDCPSPGRGLAVVITTVQVSDPGMRVCGEGREQRKDVHPPLLLSPAKPRRGSSAPSPPGAETGLPVPA